MTCDIHTVPSEKKGKFVFRAPQSESYTLKTTCVCGVTLTVPFKHFNEEYVESLISENKRLREAFRQISPHLQLSDEVPLVNTVYRSDSESLRLRANMLENRDKAIRAVRAALEGKNDQRDQC